MEAMTLPRQLIVTVDGSTNIANVTRALKMIRGVTSIRPAKAREKVKPAVKKPRLYDPETGEELNDKTMKVIEDVRNGKEPVYEMKSMEEFKAWCESL